jgi:hypothetical protein
VFGAPAEHIFPNSIQINFRGAHAPSRAVFGALAEHIFPISNEKNAAVIDRRYKTL